MLDNVDIDRSTIQVYESGGVVFTEGDDYLLIESGNAIFVRVVVGGRLDPAVDPMVDSFLVDYDYDASESLSPLAMQSSGGSRPHNNVMPFQTISFIVALFGIYPSRQ